MEPLILSIDCGTQSLRALLFNKQGKIQAMEKIVFEQPYFGSVAGQAEQDAQVYYTALCDAVNKLREKHKDLFAQIAGVAVATQRDTIVFLDKSGRPLRPCILWLASARLSCALRMSLTKQLSLPYPMSSQSKQ